MPAFLYLARYVPGVSGKCKAPRYLKSVRSGRAILGNLEATSAGGPTLTSTFVVEQLVSGSQQLQNAASVA